MKQSTSATGRTKAAPLQFCGSFFFFLERVLDHQVECLLIGHPHGLETDVQNRIRQHPQHLLIESQPQIFAVVQIPFIRHHLLRVDGPPLHIGPFEKMSATDAAIPAAHRWRTRIARNDPAWPHES